MRWTWPLLLMIFGCGGSDPGFLSVDVRTDFVAAIEVAEIEIGVFSVADSRGPSATRPVELDDDLIRGTRVATFDELLPGDYRVDVRLRNEDGTIVAERRARLNFRDEPTTVTIVMTRDCQQTVCPDAASDPSFTECLAGRCVPPECTVENPDECGGPDCATDAGCSLMSTCAEGRCVEGTCFAEPIEGACLPQEYCDAEEGCQGGVCGEGSAGSVCRPTDGLCDVPEVCSGEALLCPPDVLAAAGTTCADGFCDDMGQCGPCAEGTPCQADGACEVGFIECDTGAPICVTRPADAGTICRDTVQPCDAAEVCDGSNVDCPADAPLLDGCAVEFRESGEFTFDIPVGCSELTAQLWGAGGGAGGANAVHAAGGYAEGSFAVTPGSSIAVFVGAPGGPGSNIGGAGGAPGGGDGGGGARFGGGGGGGFSALALDTPITPAGALLIAGGGGGSGGGLSTAAGAGGGETGEDGTGGGGSQDSGGTGSTMGTMFQGGAGAGGRDAGGGGGGGWFGGGSGPAATDDAFGGGGGSGYAADSLTSSNLVGGSRAMAGNGGAAERNGAGSPSAPGAVLLRCQ